jgi:hypothetical protein
MRKGKETARQEKGQTLVEFALISVILFTMIVGIADLARLYFTYTSLTNASREGARFACVNPYDTSGITTRTEDLLIIFGTDPRIDISFPDGSRDVMMRVRVDVTCDFELLILDIPPFEMNANSTMRIETVP